MNLVRSYLTFEEDKHFKKYAEMKEAVKQQRIKGIMDAERQLEAIDEIVHQINVWNAWDKVEVGAISKKQLKGV